MKKTLVVIDDEVQIRRLLKVSLEANGFDIVEAANAKDGIAAVASYSPEAVILDLGLPDLDGMQVLKQLREWFEKAIVILSVRDSESQIVEALDVGADDYVTKPFGIPELLARIRVAIRNRSKELAAPIFECGSIKVDFSQHKVTKAGFEIHLTATEFQCLRLLTQNAGKVLTHGFLLKNIWGPNAVDNTQYLRVYIGHLRQKLEHDANQPKLILTEPGIGYRFVL